jgi:putative spermidine/putrescine transport system substrate-binding protein
MKRRLGVTWSVMTLLISACAGATSPSPSSAAASSSAPASAASPSAAESASPSTAPSPSLPSAIGAGEGELDIVIWPGYAEDGSNVKEYDWVHPFEKETKCTVKSKPADTSDDMYTLMTQNHGLYDGVSASGDASNRLIEAGEIAPINPTLIPNWNDITPFLQNISANTVDGIHYGVSHGWGGNTLMFRTDQFSPAPTSWDAVFDTSKMGAYKGKVTAYAGTIYMADAALYLKAHKPDLGITDPYELTQPQFDAVVQLLKDQRPFVGKYWATYTDEIDNFTNGTSTIGTTWQYQTNTLLGSSPPVAVKAIVPTEGMTGWSDTWMLSKYAKHPNCMMLWQAYMVRPEVQAQVAEYFGEAPANPKACATLNKGYGSYKLANFCDAYHVTDETFYNSIQFWKTPSSACGDNRGATCIGYDQWLRAYTDVKS